MPRMTQFYMYTIYSDLLMKINNVETEIEETKKCVINLFTKNF